MTNGSVTTMIDRLERSGHAERGRETDDRRRVLGRPTQRARDLASTCHEGITGRRTAPAANSFTVPELELIIRFLAASRGAYEAALGDVRAL